MAFARNQDLAICLRGTFIDVEGPLAAAQRGVRCRSEEPRSCASGDENPAPDTELQRRYLAELRGALAALAGAADARRHLVGAEGGLRSANLKQARDRDACSDATTADSMSSGLPSPAAAPAPWAAASRRREPGRTALATGANTTVAARLLEAKAADGAAAAAASEPSQQWQGSLGSKLSWADASEPEVAPASGCNVGSLGHPELCNRPCMHMSAHGRCYEGERCEYCHLDHPKRSSHLDKRHRELLRSLSGQEWSAIIMPIVTKKVDALARGSGRCRILVERLGRAASLAGGAQSAAAPPRQLRMMVLTLRSMTLKSLISAVCRSMPGAGEAVCELGRELTECLRQEVTRR